MVCCNLRAFPHVNGAFNCVSVRSERLVESLRLPQVPILHAQVFLFFRVLLLRMSPQHLTSLWPTMITELVRLQCLSFTVLLCFLLFFFLAVFYTN